MSISSGRRTSILAGLATVLLAGCADDVRQPTAPHASDRRIARAVSSTGIPMMRLGSVGGRGGQPNAINDSGLVVGGAADEFGIMHAFIWSKELGFRDFGNLGGGGSFASVNDAGVAVGTGHDQLGSYPVIWDRFNSIRRLYVPGTWSNCTAQSINRYNTVVGTCNCGNGVGIRAVMWPPTGQTPVSLGALPSTLPLRESEAIGLDIHGTVIGTSATSDIAGKVPTIKMLHQPMQRLFPQLSPLDVTAAAVSPLFGYVVGDEVQQRLNSNGDHVVQAYLFDGTSITGLGSLSGDVGRTTPWAVNDRRWVVGLDDAPNRHAAFLWRPGRGIEELGNWPGAGLVSTPSALNNKNVVVGSGEELNANNEVVSVMVMWIVP